MKPEAAPIGSAWSRDVVFATGPSRFYVYEHINRTTGEVFYVGKGCGARAWSRSSRNRHWRFIEAAHGRIVRLIATFLTEEQAFRIEEETIASYADGQLATYVAGGSGISGYRHTDRAKRAMSEKRKGRSASEAARRHMSETIRSRPDLLQLRSDFLSGPNNPAKKPENRARSSARMKARNPTHDPEVLERIRLANTGRKLSAEHRRKLGDALRGQKRGPMPENVRVALQAVRNARKTPVQTSCGLWFESALAAAKALGLRQGSISNNCAGRTKSAGGYVWSFARDVV